MSNRREKIPISRIISQKEINSGDLRKRIHQSIGSTAEKTAKYEAHTFDLVGARYWVEPLIGPSSPRCRAVRSEGDASTFQDGTVALSHGWMGCGPPEAYGTGKRKLLLSILLLLHWF